MSHIFDDKDSIMMLLSCTPDDEGYNDPQFEDEDNGITSNSSITNKNWADIVGGE